MELSSGEVRSWKGEADAIRRQAAVFDTRFQAVIGTTTSGEIVYWNGAAERLYGWKAEEVEGRSIVDVTPSAATREQAEEIMERLRAGRSWSGEFRVRSKLGEEFQAVVQDVPVQDSSGKLIGLVGISSRR